MFGAFRDVHTLKNSDDYHKYLLTSDGEDGGSASARARETNREARRLARAAGVVAQESEFTLAETIQRNAGVSSAHASRLALNIVRSVAATRRQAANANNSDGGSGSDTDVDPTPPHPRPAWRGDFANAPAEFYSKPNAVGKVLAGLSERRSAPSLPPAARRLRELERIHRRAARAAAAAATAAAEGIKVPTKDPKIGQDRLRTRKPAAASGSFLDAAAAEAGVHVPSGSGDDDSADAAAAAAAAGGFDIIDGAATAHDADGMVIVPSGSDSFENVSESEFASATEAEVGPEGEDANDNDDDVAPISTAAAAAAAKRAKAAAAKKQRRITNRKNNGDAVKPHAVLVKSDRAAAPAEPAAPALTPAAAAAAVRLRGDDYLSVLPALDRRALLRSWHSPFMQEIDRVLCYYKHGTPFVLSSSPSAQTTNGAPALAAAAAGSPVSEVAQWQRAGGNTGPIVLQPPATFTIVSQLPLRPVPALAATTDASSTAEAHANALTLTFRDAYGRQLATAAALFHCLDVATVTLGDGTKALTIAAMRLPAPRKSRKTVAGGSATADEETDATEGEAEVGVKAGGDGVETVGARAMKLAKHGFDLVPTLKGYSGKGSKA